MCTISVCELERGEERNSKRGTVFYSFTLKMLVDEYHESFMIRLGSPVLLTANC